MARKGKAEYFKNGIVGYRKGLLNEMKAYNMAVSDLKSIESLSNYTGKKLKLRMLIDKLETKSLNNGQNVVKAKGNLMRRK